MTVTIPVNARHQKILDWLIQFGLQPYMDVYEIGCGTGAVTSLIADYLGEEGSLLAVDVDPDRAVVAQQLERENVHVFCADGSSSHPGGRYDVIVLPDVLEHISSDRHKALFRLLAGCLRPGGFVFIHLPNPAFLNWLHEVRSPLLQKPIDEPVPTRALLAAAEPVGFYLHHLETYSIWVENYDYQAIVLRHRSDAHRFQPEDAW